MGTKPIAEGSKRVDMHLCDPDQLTIIGAKPFTGHAADTEDGQEHDQWDERVRTLAREKLDPNRVANVKKFNVKEPIIVKRERETGRLIVADGRHRTAWARAANAELREAGEAPLRVRVIVEDADDKTLAGLSVALNEARDDDGILVKARKVARLKERGYSIDELAATFACSKQTIRNYESLLRVHPDVLKAVDDGKIGASAAFELAKLPRDEQPTALAVLLANGNGTTTAREVKALSRGVRLEADGGEGDGEPEGDGGDGAPRTPRASALATGKPMAITRGDLRKLYDHLAENPKALKGISIEDFIAWQLGELSYRRIAGFADILREAGVLAKRPSEASAEA